MGFRIGGEWSRRPLPEAQGPENSTTTTHTSVTIHILKIMNSVVQFKRLTTHEKAPQWRLQGWFCFGSAFGYWNTRM